MADVKLNEYRFFIAVKESISELDWPMDIQGVDVLAHAIATHPMLTCEKPGQNDYKEWTKTVGDTCEWEDRE